VSNNRGINRITLSDEQIAKFYTEKNIDITQYDLRPNEYVLFSSAKNEVISLNKMKNKNIVDLEITKLQHDKSFKPLNLEQKCAFDLMSNNDIKIKILAGIAGSGKTKIAIKYGLEKLLNEEIKTLFIVRQPSPVGEEVGYFKGDKITKVLNWSNPIKDNLDDTQMTLEEMIDKEKVEIDIPALMKGRDIKNAWIIVDEAEDLTEEQFKMLGERVSKGSYIIFTGDINQIAKNQYKKNNGLLRVYNLRGIEEFGCVELLDDVRSKTSKIFANLY